MLEQPCIRSNPFPFGAVRAAVIISLATCSRRSVRMVRSFISIVGNDLEVLEFENLKLVYTSRRHFNLAQKMFNFFLE
jgi:hypothetical protein